MNHFISLKLTDGGTLTVRPEHISAVRVYDGDYETIILTNGHGYEIHRGQFGLDKLINHTSHAGVRVLG